MPHTTTTFTGVKSIDDSEVTYMDDDDDDNDDDNNQEEQEANLHPPFSKNSTSTKNSTFSTNENNHQQTTTTTISHHDNDTTDIHVPKRKKSTAQQLVSQLFSTTKNKTKKSLMKYDEFRHNDENEENDENDEDFYNEEEFFDDSTSNLSMSTSMSTSLMSWLTPMKTCQILYMIFNVVNIVLSVCLIALGFAFYSLLIDALLRLVSCIVGLGGCILFLLRISDQDKNQVKRAFQLLLVSQFLLVAEFLALSSILVYVKVRQVRTELQGVMWSAALVIDLTTIPLLMVGVVFVWLIRRRRMQQQQQQRSGGGSGK